MFLGYDLKPGTMFLGYDLKSGTINVGTSVAGGGQNGHSLVGGSLSSMSDPRGYSLNSLYSMIRLREVNLLSQVSFAICNSSGLHISSSILILVLTSHPAP